VYFVIYNFEASKLTFYINIHRVLVLHLATRIEGERYDDGS
jgi:hypothetical protein